MTASLHDDEFVKSLFDKMGPTYAITNLVSSFGFSELWRRQCVRGACIESGDGVVVCDMMAGSGECWRYISRDIDKVISIDFSTFMNGQQERRAEKNGRIVDVLCESAVATSLADNSVDHIVSAFGLKTLSDADLEQFGREIFRILKPGGSFSLIEISIPSVPFIRAPYTWYLSAVIPLLGKVLLGDIECYRYLGEYTKRFQSCESAVERFAGNGLELTMKNHFFGCATSLVGEKPA